MAVDTNFQGCKLGSFLLIDALKRTLVVSHQIGIAAVIVDAKDVDAVNFYKHFGFIAFSENTHRLFLPLETIKTTIAKKIT